MAPLLALVLAASCSVSPLDPTGKLCSDDQRCPEPYVCLPTPDGLRSCESIACANAGGGQPCGPPAQGICSRVGLVVCDRDTPRCALDGGDVYDDGGFAPPPGYSTCFPLVGDCATGATRFPDGGFCRAKPDCEAYGLRDGGDTLADAGSCWPFDAGPPIGPPPPLEDCPAGFPFLADAGPCRTVPGCAANGVVDGGKTLPDAGSCNLPNCVGQNIGAPCPAGTGLGVCAVAGRVACGFDDIAYCQSPDGGGVQPEQCDGVDHDCDGQLYDAPGCIITLFGMAGPPALDSLTTASIHRSVARWSGGGYLTGRPALGKVLVVERYAHVLREIDFGTQQVSVVAGTGRCGFSDGPVATAEFCEPVEAVSTPDGGWWVSDSRNHRIRLVAGGQVSTWAGSGTAGYTSDGPASSAQFRLPQGLAYLDGGLFIADMGNHVVRMVWQPTDGGVRQVKLVAGAPGASGSTDGTGASAQFDTPLDVEVDGAGGLLVSEFARLRAIKGNAVTSVLGTGVPGFYDRINWLDATPVAISGPRQIFLRSDGSVFFTDASNRIRVAAVGPNATAYTSVGDPSSGPQSPAGLQNAYFAIPNLNYTSRTDRPSGITAFGPGDQYLFIDANHRLRTVVGGSYMGFSQVLQAFNSPNVPVHSDDYSGGASNAEVQSDRMSWGAGLGRSSTGALYWAEPRGSLIRTLPVGSASAVYVADGPGIATGANGSAKVASAHALCVDARDRLFVADALNHAIRYVSDAGSLDYFAGATPPAAGYNNDAGTLGQFNSPYGIACAQAPDGGNRLYVSDTGNQVVRVVDADRGTLGLLAGTPGLAGSTGGAPNVARFTNPGPLAATDAYVFVLDNDGTRVRRVRRADGFVETTPQYLFPIRDPARTVAADSAGRAYAATDREIFELQPDGGMKSQFGDPIPGWQDGALSPRGPGAVWTITGLVATPERFFITDATSRRIRQIWRTP